MRSGCRTGPSRGRTDPARERATGRTPLRRSSAVGLSLEPVGGPAMCLLRRARRAGAGRIGRGEARRRRHWDIPRARSATARNHGTGQPRRDRVQTVGESGACAVLAADGEYGHGKGSSGFVPGPVDAAVLEEGAVVREAGTQCLVSAVGGGDGGDLFLWESPGYRGQPVEPPGKEVALPPDPPTTACSRVPFAVTVMLSNPSGSGVSSRGGGFHVFCARASRTAGTTSAAYEPSAFAPVSAGMRDPYEPSHSRRTGAGAGPGWTPASE